MIEEFADVYYRGGHVCFVGCVGLEKRSDLLQHDLSGGYGAGILFPVFVVPSGD